MKTENKLTTPIVCVRIYNFADPSMGYGDGGTYAYAEIPLTNFTEVAINRHDGSVAFYRYEPKTENGIIETANGEKIDIRGKGMHLSTYEERSKEYMALKELLKRIQYAL